MQAKRTKRDIVRLAETTRRHPFNAVYDTGIELFLGTHDGRGDGGAGFLVDKSLAKNTDLFKQVTNLIGRLRFERYGPLPALKIVMVYAITSSYDEEEVERFYMDLEVFYREDRTFFMVIIRDFNAKTEPLNPEEGFKNATLEPIDYNGRKRVSGCLSS
ncbi:unnamed protein product [Angiostrongylus costaricensis]|uniref:PBECR2 domain-containing protein n=1 Tax=Angiostrongylus costaricensis TaxID=334426 RepID=A0A0R3P9G6_ANGCS|nr:unnamed protein product [Angiostrongylus costaricensis]